MVLTRVLAVVALLFGATGANAEESSIKEKILSKLNFSRSKPAAVVTKAEAPQNNSGSQTSSQPQQSNPNQSAQGTGGSTPQVNLTEEERKRSAIANCKLIAVLLGRDPSRCEKDPERYYEELAAEQRKKAEADELKNKAADARKAKLEEEKRKKELARQAAEKKAADDKAKADAEKQKKTEELRAAQAKKAEEDRKAQLAAQKDAEARAAEAERRAKQEEQARKEAEARAEAERKKAEEAARKAEDARRLALEANKKVDQLQEGREQRTVVARIPPHVEPQKPKPIDTQKRNDRMGFAIMGLAGAGTYYGFGANGTWNPAFLDERFSVKMGLGGVQISNSDLDIRGMDSANRLYWNPVVAFNVLKRNGIMLDVGPSYTWIGKFGPHMNTVRMFGLQSTAGYKRFELMLGLGQNSVDNGFLDEGWMFHGSLGYRLFGF